MAGEADEALQVAGFVPCEEMQDEGSDDDKDGSLCPPPLAFAGGGGTRITQMQHGSGWVPMKLWSSDEDTGTGAGFVCVHDISKNIFYAKLEIVEGANDEDGEATKGAITTLLDVAEACNSRKISLGLAPEHAGCAELICSLLYLGFQVVPSRKSPLVNTALLLDFDLGWPGGGLPNPSDHTCTGTSECSTSAEDDFVIGNDALDSD